MLRLISRYFRRASAKKLLGENLEKIEKLTGQKIKNHALFVEALSHRSVIDGEKFKVSNERLEFLGDSVIGFLVAEYLFAKFPRMNEGELTKMRANLVNKTNLFLVAKRMDLFNLLFIHDDLITCENFGFKTLLADAFEAFAGAVFIDCGLNTTAQFVKKVLLEPSLKQGRHLADENYKSQLLEYVQALKMDIPKYDVISEDGPEHDRTFTVQVSIGSRIAGEGKGRSKKSAEQKAAEMALQIIEDSKLDFIEEN